MPTATWRSARGCAIDGVTASQTTSFSSNDVGVTALGGSKASIRRCLLAFDLNQPPDIGAALENGTIASAALLMHITNLTGAGGWDARLQRITQPAWTGYPFTTWQVYALKHAWATIGGDMDLTTPLLFTSPLTTSGGGGDFRIDGLAPYVLDALSDRAGILHAELKSDDEGKSTSETFVATAAGDNRPRLEITYATGATIDARDDGHVSAGRQAAPLRSPAGAARPATPAGGARPARPA